MTRRSLLMPLAAVAVLLSFTLPLRGEGDNGNYPKPSPFPISWELTMDHAKPKRFVYQGPGDATPVAYWYVTYHVANNTDRDKVPFFPKWEMVDKDGSVVRSDQNIAAGVFDAIKQREPGLKYLESPSKIAGDLLQGEDQSKDCVAIWAEPSQRMATFTIYASGFCGETATVKAGDKDVTLHKTLQLTYHVSGDNSAVTEDEDSQFIMR